MKLMENLAFFPNLKLKEKLSITLNLKLLASTSEIFHSLVILRLFNTILANNLLFYPFHLETN